MCIRDSAKFLWLLFVIITPYLGVFVYLIARGDKMRQNSIDVAKQQEAAMRSYIQQAAGTGPSVSEELVKLADLLSLIHI